MKDKKIKKLSILSAIMLVAILLTAFAINAAAEDEIGFTVAPKNIMERVGVATEFSWNTDNPVDKFNVMIFDANSGKWKKEAEIEYDPQGNSYSIKRDSECSVNVRIEALIKGIVKKTVDFSITYTSLFKISFDLSPLNESMEPAFAKGKYTLPYYQDPAPEGYRFVAWQIGNETYSRLSDINVQDNILVKAVWEPVVELPVKIDGSSLVGKKSPLLAQLELPLSDMYYFCDGYDCASCKYGGTGAMWGPCQPSNAWYDIETDEAVTSFEDGKAYYYRVAIHANEKNGYVLPELSSVPENGFIQITGVDWISVNDYVHGQEEHDRKQFAVHFNMIYNSDTGIGGLNGAPVDNIVLDGSSLIGIKTPKPLQIEENDIYYACSPECDCAYKAELGTDEIVGYGWSELGGEGKAVKEFADGGTYMLFVMLHLKEGYILPTPLSNDFVKVGGINWIATNLMPMGSKTVMALFLTQYDEGTGIMGDGSHVCQPTLVEEKAPTCELDGKMEYYSCICNKVFRDAEGTEIIEDLASYGIIPATGHDYESATCVLPATCSNEGCGKTLGSVLAGGKHNLGEPATCTSPQFCLDCGAPLSAALGHDLSEATCTSATTCKRSGCGAVVGAPIDHNYSAATCTSPKTCTVCAATLGIPLAHSFGDEWESDENGHFKKCSCGAKSESLAHIYPNVNNSCYFCGFAEEIAEPEGLSAGAIVGIIIGSVTVAGIGGFAIFWFVIKKKSLSDIIAVFKKGSKESTESGNPLNKKN